MLNNILYRNFVHICIFLFLFATYPIKANEYKIKLPDKLKPLISGHLDLGGNNLTGDSITFNNYYMMMNEKPFIPIIGEFHYIRTPREYWEEQLLKMKSGGINVIATYIFWIYHEENEGIFEWKENKDLRYFTELCKKHGLYLIARIGPHCHGEIRNGGLPDWLYGRDFEVRSNDPAYLAYTDRLYGEISKQLMGLLYKDNGPVIGIQLENELQHSSGKWHLTYHGKRFEVVAASFDESITMEGVSSQQIRSKYFEQGNQHMHALKELAIKNGLKVPLYTATGWGNAAIVENGSIPVTAGYPYPFWAKREKTGFTLFKDIRQHPDYAPVRFQKDHYPTFTAEMGVGMAMVYHSRPDIPAESGYAMMVRTLGSGANGLGYYMYHGGITPKGFRDKVFMSDDPVGLPKMNYDFQAPIGEYGYTREIYNRLRLLHLFVNDFGHIIAPMQTTLPDNNNLITPDNQETLRFAVRSINDGGFVFMTNFQDNDIERTDQDNLVINVETKNGHVRIPETGSFTLKKDKSLILPFNLKLHDACLKYSTTQLLSKIIEDDGIEHYYFFAIDGVPATFSFDEKTIKGKRFYNITPGINSMFTITSAAGKRIRITTLSEADALLTQKVSKEGRESLLITTSTSFMKKNGDVILESVGNPNFTYCFLPQKRNAKFHTLKKDSVTIHANTHYNGSRKFSVNIDPLSFNNIKDVIMQIDYTGDILQMFHKGKMLNDHFYNGNKWNISLRYYQNIISTKDNQIDFLIHPLFYDAPFLQDLPMNIQYILNNKNKLFSLNDIKFIPVYSTIIKIP